MEPHFFHLAKDGQTSCGGGEGPRHHEVKMMLAKEFAARDDIKHVQVEYRVGKYVVDIFLQTDFGPFYFEIIDTHAPEAQKYIDLEGRIIPFWIDRFDDLHLDDMSRLRGHELLKFHFSTIRSEVSQSRKGTEPEQIWYNHLILGILVRVQDCHRDFYNDMPTYYAYVNERSRFSLEEVAEGYRKASRRILREGKKLRSR